MFVSFQLCVCKSIFVYICMNIVYLCIFLRSRLNMHIDKAINSKSKDLNFVECN